MSWFCKHKWKEKERHNVIRTYYNDGSTMTVILVIQECKKCGKIKKVYLP